MPLRTVLGQSQKCLESSPQEVDYGEWREKQALLATTLQLAVPLWIERLRERPWEYVQQRAKECSQHIAGHGDNLLFRAKKKGQSAEAFNRLAEGIACLSFCPGGVKIFGQHWEACLEEEVGSRSSAVLMTLLQAITGVLSGRISLDSVT